MGKLNLRTSALHTSCLLAHTADTLAVQGLFGNQASSLEPSLTREGVDGALWLEGVMVQLLAGTPEEAVCVSLEGWYRMTLHI